MTQIALIVLLLTVLTTIGGCTFQRIGLELYDPHVYQKSEADAIQAEVQCKALARTPVQVARCVGNRR